MSQSGIISSASSAVGDVDGPASSTDNAVARFDGTTGKQIQNSLAILSDVGDYNVTTSTATAGAGFTITNVAAGAGSSTFLNLTTQNGQSYVTCATVQSGSANAFSLGVATISSVDCIELNTGQAPSTGTRLALITPRSIGFFNRGMRYKRVETAASYVVLQTDYYVGITSTAAPRTVTLPSSFTDSMTGVMQTFIIKDQSGGAAANNITVTVSGGAINIDGALTAVINTNYGSITVVWNGTQYYIV